MKAVVEWQQRMPSKGNDNGRLLQHPLGKPKAWNISSVRQAMSSDWPNCSGPAFWSMIRVVISGKPARKFDLGAG